MDSAGRIFTPLPLDASALTLVTVRLEPQSTATIRGVRLPLAPLRMLTMERCVIFVSGFVPRNICWLIWRLLRRYRNRVMA